MLSRIANLLTRVDEAKMKIGSSLVIRDGKKVKEDEYKYSSELPEGYKRDEDGNPVRYSLKERQSRSQASRISQSKASTKSAKARSMTIRSNAAID